MLALGAHDSVSSLLPPDSGHNVMAVCMFVTSYDSHKVV